MKEAKSAKDLHIDLVPSFILNQTHEVTYNKINTENSIYFFTRRRVKLKMPYFTESLIEQKIPFELIASPSPTVFKATSLLKSSKSKPQACLAAILDPLTNEDIEFDHSPAPFSAII
ncbi:hypothetical protein BpHYR1_031330 [Brachionus plicatilis]|uniref:Uncharacterized protein n=1 Tax=Brachionus plicatilis TaxID=10195 RepID=A0A3M7QRF7_BRAPC|nr:hypothetical protein BpHYR1_031330 [Brachionus plicatilis]